MHTLLDILKKSETLLAERGVVEARLDGEHLLAEVLGCKRMDLYLQFDRPMEEETLARLRPRRARRARREPLSYILGHHPFHDLHLIVRPGVLIPRPETEDLAQMTTERLSASPKRILDLGTGSGALALWMKSTFPEAEVTGSDLSAAALDIARENGENLGLSVNWVRSEWFESLEGTFDLIVANPPYLTEAEWRESEPEVRQHEPREALVAPEDGIAHLKLILAGAPQFLNPGGLLALETGIAQHKNLRKLSESAGCASFSSEADLENRERYFFAFAK